MSRRRSSSSVSTMQIMAVVVVLLAVGITLAFIYAPDKPAPPPTSAISFAERPEKKSDKRSEYEPSEAPVIRASQRRRPPDASAKEEEKKEKPEPEPYRIVVTAFDSKTGQPLGNVRLRAYRELSDDEQRDIQERTNQAIRDRDVAAHDALLEEQDRLRQNRRVTTREDGKGILSFPLTGVFAVEALMEGYMPAKAEEIVIDEKHPEQEVEIKLSLGAVIKGRITETGSNVGAAGVRVELDYSQETSRDLLLAYHGRWPVSDEDGNYRMSGLPPGNYSLTLNLSGSPYKLGKILPYKKVQITSPDQEVAGVDFTVDAAGIIWGYVTDTNQAPIKGVDVLLCTSSSIFTQAVNSFVRRESPIHGKSAEDGYYELMGVPLNEEWRVYATSDNHSPQLAEPFMLTASQRTVRIDIFMFAGSTIYGRVVDDRGNPLSEAQVMCLPAYSQMFSPLESPQAFREAKTDENGNFELRELPAGNYQVFAMKKGYKYAASGEPVYPNGYTNISNVQIVLYPVDQGEYAVFGTVMDLARQPLPGVSVVLEGLSTAGFDEIQKETTTDGSGQYRFDGISTGMYKVTASKDGYAPQTIHRVLFNMATDIILETRAVVRGQVLVKGGGPIKTPFTVSATTFNLSGQGIISLAGFGERPESQTFQSPDGRFELYLSSGQYQLEAKAEGYTPGRANISLEPGQVLEDVVINLSTEGGTIEGKVVTSDGKSPQGALVVLVESGSSIEAALMAAMDGGGSGRSMRVGEDGVFSFTSLAEGVYNAVAQHASYASADSGPLELAAQGHVQGITLRLGTGGAIEGRVYINGAIAANAMVMIAGQGTTKTTTTDQNGHYYVDGLATGTYQLVVAPVGSGDISGLFDTRGVSVDVMEGRTTRYDFGATGGVTIEGRCTPGPQFGGVVVLRPPSPQVIVLGETAQMDQLIGGMNTMVNPLGGSFIFEDVQPGEWQVDVFYVQFGSGVRYVHTELITITGEQQVVPLDLNVQM